VTRIISLTAEGLTAAQLPELIVTDVPGIKQYADKPVFEDQRSTDGINGVRRQRTAIIPTGAGRYTLPEIAIPWWNLKTGQQEIARIPARTIEASRAVNGTTALQSVDELTPLLSEDSAKLVVRQSGLESFWMWASVILAVGWISSILVWWFIRREFDWRSVKSPHSPEISLRKANNKLHRVCVNNNVSEARSALLNWANTIVVSHKFINLNQVTRYFGNPLKAQVDLLNQSIYSPSAGDWNGELLWEICQEISAESVSLDENEDLRGLHPLNP